MKTILITGVAGFLGSHLAKDLVAEGNRVIGVDNLSTGKMSNIDTLLKNDNFVFIQADASSEKWLLLDSLSDVREIYHLASPASPKYYQSASLETISINTVGTMHMLELARRTGAKMLYTSTSEAYGDPDVHPQPEHYRGNVNTWGPRACYDESKRLGEVFCYEYFHKFQVDIRVARIFNTYSAGLRSDDGRVISNFVDQALTGKDLTVYGDGMQTRSFCYADDTIRGLKLMMEKEAASGEIINIGNPTEHTILELAEYIDQLTGGNCRITFHPLPIDDPKQRRPNIEKANNLLGWEPVIDLKEGLRRMIREYRQ
ncbi:GDP-mannose 4,6-dehydratase [Paenibacillus lutimineralis]|uniref:UDP-glucuronate decarboxylase n=1 Tax=Paenibacillus lutimineralis TaxID=2707005 RepID=A0A3Q9I992_9BACL|nr:GDP-mannose 4,6-dehydratase [Paenibacillus lutimineralis]AZS15585.1 NAD-dependent epimerase/dehydratase family protein [Paenibacillus lutimineralis]